MRPRTQESVELVKCRQERHEKLAVASSSGGCCSAQVNGGGGDVGEGEGEVK